MKFGRDVMEKILRVYHGFDVVADCFEIQRLQYEIEMMDKSRIADPDLRNKKGKRLVILLAKYKDAFEEKKG